MAENKKQLVFPHGDPVAVFMTDAMFQNNSTIYREASVNI